MKKLPPDSGSAVNQKWCNYQYSELPLKNKSSSLQMLASILTESLVTSLIFVTLINHVIVSGVDWKCCSEVFWYRE